VFTAALGYKFVIAMMVNARESYGLIYMISTKCSPKENTVIWCYISYAIY